MIAAEYVQFALEIVRIHLPKVIMIILKDNLFSVSCSWCGSEERNSFLLLESFGI